MAAGRHRGTRRRKPRRLLIFGAIVAALAMGGAGYAIGWPGQQQPSAAPEPITQQDAASAPSSEPAPRTQDEERVTRSDERPELGSEEQAGSADVAPRLATEPKFLTEDLNVRTEPSEDAPVLTVIDEGAKIGTTGRVVDGWAEIVYDGKLRWVTAEFLSTERPEDDTDETDGSDESDESDDSGGLSDEPCESGSSVEAGLVANAIAVHRAVCAEFPEVTTYYGLRPGDDGYHGTGQAIDIMIPDSATGDAIAEFVQDNYEALGVSEIIWSQQIWTVERASEGWRWMEDMGSDTANHYDHVHVSVY